jgi:hypothetical protein
MSTLAGVAKQERLEARIRGEFLEMPGLKLTLRQAARIFGGDALTVKRLLDELTREGYLIFDRRGMYRRATPIARRELA